MKRAAIHAGMRVIYREAGFGTPKPATVVTVHAIKVTIAVDGSRTALVHPRSLTPMPAPKDGAA
jgi:hypothetical protein